MKTCQHYGVCKKGKCICPKKEECPQYSQRVCASDGQVYTNDCLMKAESCKLGKTLIEVGMEKCCMYKFIISLCIIVPFIFNIINYTSMGLFEHINLKRGGLKYPPVLLPRFSLTRINYLCPTAKPSKEALTQDFKTYKNSYSRYSVSS